MNIYNDFTDLPTSIKKHPAVITVGVFDGLHMAHRKLLTKVKEYSGKYPKGISVIITFRNHPAKILTPEQTPPLLISNQEKVNLLISEGIDVVVNINFTHSFSKITPNIFINNYLLKYFNIAEIVVGHDHTFGSKSTGNVELLKEIGKKEGFKVRSIPPVLYKNQIVSSSLIRELIQQGNILLATKLLTKFYSISGKVVKGRQVGQQIGFPTANLQPENELLPCNGVYAVLVDFDGMRFHGVMNIGNRPTFNGIEKTYEIHLLNYEGNLYGKKLKITFIAHLRNEIKFSSIDQLVKQIQNDISKAHKIFLAYS